MLKKEVLRKDADFNRLYKKGESVGGRYVVIFYKKNGLPYNRLGFLASKKVGNSVRRNRARRLMKESFRKLSSGCKEGYDFVFIARNTIEGKKLGDVMSSMDAALKKAGVKK